MSPFLPLSLSLPIAYIRSQAHFVRLAHVSSLHRAITNCSTKVLRNKRYMRWRNGARVQWWRTTRDRRHWVSRRWERYYVLSDAIFLLRPPVTSRNLRGRVAKKLPLRLSTLGRFQDFSRRRQVWTTRHRSIGLILILSISYRICI